ncbi:MAG: terminase, partial [Gammaproteobacteria bacterium]|nr:terminase [Gammaproteobacteria bacterium]
SKHIVDIHQAVKQCLNVNIEELKDNLDDEDAWKQEYELKWLDEAGAWLSYDIINGVEHEQAGIPGLYTGQPVYVGNDIGLRRHLWALWVWEPIGDVLWTREIRTLARAKFADHDDVIAEIFDRYRVARLCMDQTSIGERSVEEMQSVHGEDVVEGVLFNPASKLYMAQVAKRRFQDKLCRIPEGDQKLRADLHKLKQDVTPAGNARFVADSDAEGHADRAWSGFLGMYAAENPAAPIEFQSAGQRAGMREMDGMGWESGMEITDAGFGTLSGMNDFRGYI